ncbi:MAG: hypothetical protein Q4E83_02900 [bacterium]|nr:hypothetical protein [bacterium]
MKKVFVLILLALSCNSVWAKTLNVEALSDFSTANPSEYLEVKILDTYVTKNDFVIHAGSIINGKITDVKDPKRLKRNATFKFIPITYYDYVTERKYNIKKSIVGKYTSHDITPASIAKTGAVAAGNKLVGAFIGPSVAVVEGAIKNEQDNIAKSAAISVYESSPLSYVEKGKDLEIKKGDVFKINFNLGDDEK